MGVAGLALPSGPSSSVPSKNRTRRWVGSSTLRTVNSASSLRTVSPRRVLVTAAGDVVRSGRIDPGAMDLDGHDAPSLGRSGDRSPPSPSLDRAARQGDMASRQAALVMRSIKATFPRTSDTASSPHPKGGATLSEHVRGRSLRMLAARVARRATAVVKCAGAPSSPGLTAASGLWLLGDMPRERREPSSPALAGGSHRIDNEVDRSRSRSRRSSRGQEPLVRSARPRRAHRRSPCELVHEQPSDWASSRAMAGIAR